MDRQISVKEIFRQQEKEIARQVREARKRPLISQVDAKAKQPSVLIIQKERDSEVRKTLSDDAPVYVHDCWERLIQISAELYPEGIRDQKPIFVAVTNPHEYMLLLQEAMSVLYGNPLMQILSGKKKEVDTWIADTVRHELEHGIPIQGIKDAQTYYGMCFIKDPKTKNEYVSPFFYVQGHVLYGNLLDSSAAPNTLSVGDKMDLRKD